MLLRQEREKLRPDLTNCDREPIHIPGAIQSHGFLLGLDGESEIVRTASENAETWLGISTGTILGKKVDDIFEPSLAMQIHALLLAGARKGEFESDPGVCSLMNQEFDIIVHASGNQLILEFETRSADLGQVTIKKIMHTALSKIRSAESSQQLMNHFAQLVKEISGYDRVMIYQFHPDQHGEVIAEVKLDHLESLLHNHYPASDIPVQARALYKINLVRMIADVNAVPSPLLGIAGDREQPLDLTNSVLRAVSPIHIEYLKNMGVCSSFSISLLYKNELWGLIACHNYNQHTKLDYDARMACRFLGQFFSVSLEQRMEEDLKREQQAFLEASLTLRKQLTDDIDVPTALTSHPVNLLTVTRAGGAAIFFENKMYCLGKTPTELQIKQLVDFLRDCGISGIYQHTQISQLYDPAHHFARAASGILLAEISESLSEYIIWFKPEQIQNMVWAGDPDKPAFSSAEDAGKISPRTSFEKWISEIRDKSAGWQPAELLAAASLREQIGQIILKKVMEVRKLNEVLQTAYEELDTFTYTISHDLRTPLASIRNYTELVLEDHAGSLPEDAAMMLKKVVGRTQKMEQLISDVLQYTKAGRGIGDGTVIDMHELISELVDEFREQGENTNLKILTEGILDVFGDRTMIMQLFQNLLGNAVKYSAGRDCPVVIISCSPEDQNSVMYSIRDNGIGFDMQHAAKIFDLFHRLENAGRIEGTGIGLAIVKRIVEKHNGRIRVESALDQGSVFYISLPGPKAA